jgi:hypothetical protein
LAVPLAGASYLHRNAPFFASSPITPLAVNWMYCFTPSMSALMIDE